MLEKICLDVNGTTEVKVGENTINFKTPFKRITMLDAIKEHTGIDISGMDEAQLREVCKKIGVEVDETMGKGKIIDEIFGEKCEGHYIQPTFITDYPIEMSPLTKRHRNNPELTERFELMVNGKELCNAYSELNDPIDQRLRFEEQLRLSEKETTKPCSSTMTLSGLSNTACSHIGYGNRNGPARHAHDRTNHHTRSSPLPANAPRESSKRDNEAAYTTINIPAEWVAPIQKQDTSP